MPEQPTSIHGLPLSMNCTFAAIDGGPEQSGFVAGKVTRGEVEITFSGTLPNRDVIRQLRLCESQHCFYEKFESFGMAIGASTIDAIFETGRMAAHAAMMSCRIHPITRRRVKLDLCGLARAKDGNIRQALIDILGPPRVPGLEYAVSKNGGRAVRVFREEKDAMACVAEKGPEFAYTSRPGKSGTNSVYGPTMPASHIWSAIAVAYVGLKGLN